MRFGALFLILGCCLLISSCNQNQNIEYKNADEIQIIPQPKYLEIDSGFFMIDKNTVIQTFPSSLHEANYLKNLIEASSTFKIEIEVVDELDHLATTNKILLYDGGSSQTCEAYDFCINSRIIYISAQSATGIMRGIQTIRQLFVDDFHSQEKRKSWYLPNICVMDQPSFAHRGLLLDCCRHFFDKEVVKKYIDLLALYKMNTLHWHLTEDQGWRIEIEKYPKLTEVAAWRTEENGEKYGGFYTKEDIKEIVAYAAERHITIIPEIELPGHSQAAIAAYPNLSCTGKQVEVANDWGVFKDIYCAGNDSVFEFLENVLLEVMELFPSEYIHIGGDEAPKYRWENCPKCQKRIKEEQLADEHELQSYFISRIEKFLNENGRKLIGWDEILEGGLAENATVQSWRGMEGGIAAATSHHQAIMSPTSHAYFDYDLKAIDLEKVYHFDPIPEGLDSNLTKYIIGGECNMWSEHVLDENTLDSKVFPRLLAMSEVLWSYPENRDYNAFYQRVQAHYLILENLNVNYGLETVPVQINSRVENGEVWVQLKAGSPNLELEYTWENDIRFLNYKSEFLCSKTGVLLAKALKNGTEYGNLIKQEFNIHAGIGKTLTYNETFSPWYKAGGNTGLVDGKLGSTDFRDGNWQGFWGKNLDVIIDVSDIEKINYISCHFFQYNNSWIFLPEKVQITYSNDGKRYVPVKEISRKASPEKRGKFIELFETNLELEKVKFIRITAQNIMKVPDWHEAAGSDAWIFIDEIIIK